MIKRKSSDKHWTKWLWLCAIVASFIALTTAPANAQVILSTNYPGVTVTPGQTVNFNLDVTNEALPSQVIELDVSSVPEGWETRLRGGGYTINQLFVNRGETGRVDLEIDVPAEVEPGTYELVVTASAGASDSRLPLTLTVSEEATGNASMEAQYPSLRGPADAEFQYQVDLTNHFPEVQTFTFSSQAPEGWTVEMKPQLEDKEVRTLNVEGDSTETMEITVIPPSNVEAGEHTVTITASSPRARVSTDLIADITGSYALEVTTESGRLNTTATAGEEKPFPFIVRNTGSSPVQNVSFNANTPSDWSVTFDPETLDTIPPGEQREVIARIQPSGQAIAGDYQISLTASADNVSASQDFRITVNTSTLWGWIGALLVVLVAGGMFYTFRVYGRR